MLGRSEGIADDVFNVEIGPDLVQDNTQIIARLGVGQDDELHARGRFIVVQLVFAGPI